MLIINNNTLTLNYEGQLYSKEVSPDEITMIKVYAIDNDLESIVNLCFPTPKSLLKREGFWEEDGSIYYKNIKVSIPQVLAVKMLGADEEEFQRLIKFWGWLSLNPNPRSRENLYEWIEKNGIQLSNGGFMIHFRRVVNLKKKTQSDLSRFVKETYEKLRKQKKSTNQDVYLKDGDYYVSQLKYGDMWLGNLKVLYHSSIPEVTLFTDNYSKTWDYRIGKESRMDRSQGSEDDSVQCGPGFHSGSKDYGFNGFGDTPIATLINPADVLAVPRGSNILRACAHTPVAVLNKDCEWIDDPNVHQRIDECYDIQVERLESLLEQTTFEDFKKHEVLSNEWNLAVGFETVIKLLNK